MATLQTLTKITRDTIADGDKLNEAITSLTANDSAMLAETKTTNATTQDVFNTVKNTSGVKWNNDLVRNFANIKVNGSTTLTGKSKLSSNVTFTGSDTINIEKTGNKYKFTTSNAINEVSSYYKYAIWSNEISLSRHIVDPFVGECGWGNINYGSISLFDSYLFNAGGNGEYGSMDGFMKGCFVNGPNSTYQSTFSAERHPFLTYSATTNIFTSEDAPGLTGVVAHTIPTNGSFYVCDYFLSLTDNNNAGPESYCGATIVDNGSIGLGNKVFAKNFSIGFKGCSAEDYSVCMFGCANYTGFVLNNIAKTSSYAIGTNAIALNKSFVITNSVNHLPTNHITPANITADGCSIMMYAHTDCTTNNVKTSAMYLLPTSDSNTNTYVEKSFVIHNAGYKSSYKNRTLALGGFPNQYIFTREIDHSLITMNSMSYVKNSVSLYVKGSTYNSFNSLYNSVCTNVSYSGNLSATNSLILGVTYPSMTTYSISHSAIDCIEIGRAVTTYQDNKDIFAQQTVRFPGFEYDNKNHLLLLDAQPTYVARASAHSQMENSIIILPGNRYQSDSTSEYSYDRLMQRFGRNNISIKGTYYDVTPEYPTMIERNINIGFDRTSAVYSCKNNTLYNAKLVQDFEQSLVYYASAVSDMHESEHRVQKNAISLFYSNTQAGDSFAMNHSIISTPQVVLGHDEVEICTADNYCLSLFNSTAFVTYKGTSDGEIIGINDDSRRLALWKNKLTTYDLPVTQFARITSIDSLSELSTNIYYVIG
jgi:hypothetical protein